MDQRSRKSSFDNIKCTDFGKLSSYGEVIRDGKPAVVLIDFGCSNDVWKTHYVR